MADKLNKTQIVLLGVCAVFAVALVTMTVFAVMDKSNDPGQDAEPCCVADYNVTVTIAAGTAGTDITVSGDFAAAFTVPYGTDALSSGTIGTYAAMVFPGGIPNVAGTYTASFTVPVMDGLLGAFAGHYNVTIEVL